MSEDTILGGPPSGETPGPDGVVPGEGPIEDTPESPSTGEGAESEPDSEVRGDAETGGHLGRLYSLVALGFERPGEAFQRAVDEDAFRTDLVESADALDEDAAELARAVAEQVDDADALHDEWASLFGVEEGVTVSPYELTYLPGPLMTNVRKLADLAGFYEAFGLEIAPDRNDRRDHVCFLLEFAGQLAVREAVLRTEGDEAGVAVVGDARRQFLEEHLGRWYWRFADEVAAHDDHGFYAALAELLAAVVEDEIDRLDLDPEWVPDDPEVAEWTEDVFGESGRSCGGCGADAQGVQPEPPGATGPPTRGPGASGPPSPGASGPPSPGGSGPPSPDVDDDPQNRPDRENGTDRP